MTLEKILISGASGFLGRSLLQELLTHRDSQASPNQIFTLSRGQLNISGVNHTSLDLENRSEVVNYLKEIQPSQVYHLSGLSKVSNSFAFEDYFRSNYQQTQNLIDGLRLTSRKVKVLLASSVHTYGNHTEPVTERTIPRPQSPYAFSKFLSEECLKQFSKTHEHFQAVTVRLSTCFGPGQDLGFVASDFVKKIREAKLKGSKKITTGPLNSFRQFMDFRDVTQAFRLIMEQNQTVPFEIYNLASPQKTSIQTLLGELLALAEINPEIEVLDKGDNSFRGLDITAQKFHSSWPSFRFRPFKKTLLEIWNKDLKTPS